MNNNTHVVIMAGGVGKRLFPISTPERPKQFIDLLKCGKTMIQLTVERFLPICPIENFWVVTSEKYIRFIREQVPGIKPSHVLAEPEARNTAPCIAYACTKIAQHYPGANIIVSPSDAYVGENDLFLDAINNALNFTCDSNRIVTLGIVPDRPATEYGYIEAGKTVLRPVKKVLSFKEKPCEELAAEYVQSGKYFWNAGIFIWNQRTIEAQLRKYAPQIMSMMDKLQPHIYQGDESAALRVYFPQCEKISIDYAVMEKSNDIFMIPCSFTWSDLGSFKALDEIQAKMK